MTDKDTLAEERNPGTVAKQTCSMTWYNPAVVVKPILSITNEMALLSSLVSTSRGRLENVELKALDCRKIHQNYEVTAIETTFIILTSAIS